MAFCKDCLLQMHDYLQDIEIFLIVRLYCRFYEFKEVAQSDSISSFTNVNGDILSVGLRQDKIIEEFKDKYTRSQFLKAIYILEGKGFILTEYVGHTKFIKLSENGYMMFAIINEKKEEEAKTC